MTPRKIIVPVDFSPHSQAASELAVAIAGQGAEITLLHVDQLPGMSSVTPEPVYLAPQLWDSLGRGHDRAVRDRLGEWQRELAERAPEGAAVRVAVVQSDTATGILDYATDTDADLIALGSHGASAATLYLFGSITERVAKEAPCPVLVTNADIADNTPPAPFRHILVAADYSPFSAPSARLAARMLAPDGVLEFVHVWHAPYLRTMEHSFQVRNDEVYQLMETYRRAEVERLNKFIDELRLDLPSERQHAYIEAGTAPRGILRRAGDTSADLIVLGAHGREGLQERILGTVADRVLRSAPAPVLLVPETALRSRRAA